MNDIRYDDQLVADLFDAQPQPVFWMKPVWKDDNSSIIDFEYVYCNEEMYRFTGLSREQLVGNRLSTSQTMKDETKPQMLKQLVTVYQTGKKIQENFYNPKLNKHYSYLRSKIQEGVLTIIQDRTAEFKMIEEIKQASEKLNTVFNASQAGMFTLFPVKNDSGEIIDFLFGIVNEAVAIYIGETSANLQGALGSTYFPAYKENGLFDIYKDTWLNNKTHEFDFHYEDGYDVYFHIRSVKSGEEVLVTFTDQTALKKAQRDLEATILELKRSNSNLEEFAYAASHDLKEPIRKIHYFSDKLKKEFGRQLGTEGVKTFERMESATERMRMLVDDLLSYSQVSLRPRTFEKVDLNALLKSVCNDLELEIEQKKAIVNIESLPVVNGHIRQLQQLFQNLLGNALKYSSPGIPPLITISSSLQSGKNLGLSLVEPLLNQQYYCIEVQDNGIGFEQKDAERIFNVFQRLHGNTEYMGTGVGLSIARKVAENHHGFIRAKAEPGKGSRFEVILPTTA